MSLWILFDTVQKHGIKCDMSDLGGINVCIPLMDRFTLRVYRYCRGGYQASLCYVLNTGEGTIPYMRYNHITSMLWSCGAVPKGGFRPLRFHTPQHVVNTASKVKRMLFYGK